jgi:hypothetical protein
MDIGMDMEIDDYYCRYASRIVFFFAFHFIINLFIYLEGQVDRGIE